MYFLTCYKIYINRVHKLILILIKIKQPRFDFTSLLQGTQLVTAKTRQYFHQIQIICLIKNSGHYKTRKLKLSLENVARFHNNAKVRNSYSNYCYL